MLFGGRGTGEGVQGYVYTACSPTPGTGIIGHAAPTTFDSTKPYLLHYNGRPNIYAIPLYLRLTVTVVSVGNTIMRFTQVLDPGAAVNQGVTAALVATRYSSGGTTLVGHSTKSDQGGPLASSVYAGAVVASSSSAQAATISNQTYRTVIGVVGDVYQFGWGAHESNDPASLITTGAAVSNVAYNYAPIVIAPGHCFSIHQWAASQSTGPTFEVEYAWAEVPFS